MKGSELKLPDAVQKENEVMTALSALMDPLVRKKYKNLDAFLKEQKNSKLTVSEAIQIAENNITQQILEYAKGQYLLMEKKDDFIDAGEQRVALSLCRVLLNVPADREVTQSDANAFREQISALDEKLEKPSVGKLETWMKNFVFEFNEFKISHHEVEKINDWLAFLGSDKKVLFALKGSKWPSYIFGKRSILPGYHQKYKNLMVYLQETEEARTPYFILSMAASGYPWGNIIRYTSCETIFYNKWDSYFETSDFERDLLLSHEYSNIREAIKKIAFDAYQVKDKKELTAKKKLFIDEMVEGIVWHELGHEISLKDNPLITPEISQLGAAVGSFGHNAITVLKEALADWAPEKDGICGPILNFIKLAQSDPIKAKRMIFVYLSDYWFLDFGEEFMGETTDIIVPLLTQFIDDEGNLMHEKAARLHADIFNYLTKKYKEGIEGYKQILKSARYAVNSQNIVSYDVLESELIKIYRKDAEFTNATDEEIKGYQAFWGNMLGYLKKYSPEDYQKYLNYLKDFTKQFNAELLIRLTKNSKKSFTSIREFVIDSMKRIGCYETENEVTEDELFENIFEELKIPAEMGQKIKARVEDLRKGQKLDVAINYEAKPSAFIAFIQKLMMMSDYGEIRSGMSLGEDLSEEMSQAEKITEFKKIIAGIKKQISEKMFDKISILKMNTDYLSQEVYESEYKTLATGGSFDLDPLVKEKKFLPFFEEHMVEVFIPLKKGVYDWNTVQAVWRINQDLRPDAQEKQWIIDGLFIDELVDRALHS